MPTNIVKVIIEMPRMIASSMTDSVIGNFGVVGAGIAEVPIGRKGK